MKCEKCGIEVTKPMVVHGVTMIACGLITSPYFFPKPIKISGCPEPWISKEEKLKILEQLFSC